MSKQQHERILVKDDSDLFQLVRRLTSEQPPVEAWDSGRETEPAVQIRFVPGDDVVGLNHATRS
jgi:hypothetical protein